MYEKNENEPLPRREATLKNFATPSETKSRRLQYLKSLNYFMFRCTRDVQKQPAILTPPRWHATAHQPSSDWLLLDAGCGKSPFPFN